MRWIGHILRLPEDRLIKQVLVAQLKERSYHPGGLCNDAPSEPLETLLAMANNRKLWATLVTDS